MPRSKEFKPNEARNDSRRCRDDITPSSSPSAPDHEILAEDSDLSFRLSTSEPFKTGFYRFCQRLEASIRHLGKIIFVNCSRALARLRSDAMFSILNFVIVCK